MMLNHQHLRKFPELDSISNSSKSQLQEIKWYHSFCFYFQSTKFGDKKTSNYTRSIQDGGRKINPSLSEVCSQTISSLNHTPAQTIDTSLLFKKKSEITTNNLPNFLSLNYKHNPEKSKHQINDNIPRTKNISHAQDSTNHLTDSNLFSTKSLSPITQASASKDAGGSSFISQIPKEFSPSHETSSSSPQVYRGLEMTSQKFKGVKGPTVNPRSAEVTPSRGYESHHIKFGGVVAPCLLSRHTRPPLSSKGIGRPTSRDSSIHSPVSCQKPPKRYTDPPNAETSGFPLSVKVRMTY